MLRHHRETVFSCLVQRLTDRPAGSQKAILPGHHTIRSSLGAVHSQGTKLVTKIPDQSGSIGILFCPSQIDSQQNDHVQCMVAQLLLMLAQQIRQYHTGRIRTVK